MDAASYFRKAAKWQKIGEWLFRIALGLSVALIFAKDKPAEPFLSSPIAAIVFASVLVSSRYRCLLNDGNTATRNAQLADALGVGSEFQPRDGYYNNEWNTGTRRLLATTCESAFFTSNILAEMTVRTCVKFFIFLGVFITYVCFAKSDTNIVAACAQTLFSADLLGEVLAMLRYSARVREIKERLLQFFRLSANTDVPTDLAIGLSAHVDYECAKEESGILLDSKIYKKLNNGLSKQWDRLRKEFKIDPIKEIETGAIDG